jgi:hypothetical protein
VHATRAARGSGDNIFAERECEHCVVGKRVPGVHSLESYALVESVLGLRVVFFMEAVELSTSTCVDIQDLALERFAEFLER